MLKDQGMFLTADPYKRSIRMNHDSGAVVIEYVPRSYFLSVRLIRDIPPVFFGVEYGYLYNYPAIIDARNITAAGWHIPTTVELEALATYLGGHAVAGHKLREIGTEHWEAPNAGATDEVGFGARGTGYRLPNDGTFSQNKVWCMIMASNQLAPPSINYMLIAENLAETSINQAVARLGASQRPIKDVSSLSHGQIGSYTGNDGRLYWTININGVEYLGQNLCETLYRDGSPIPEVTNDATWAGLATGARCSYNNDESLAHA